MRKGSIASILLVGLIVAVQVGSPVRPARVRAGSTQANIVLVLTDDQRWDEMDHMPMVTQYLVDHGISFTNSFVVNPLCCPSRSTILTGQYSHHTDVWHNSPPHGGFETFLPRESSTIATWLHDAGYRTALIGKYLNGYDETSCDHTPAGWDEWHALAFRSNESGAGYFGFDTCDNGTRHHHPRPEYSTDVLADQAESFIASTPATQPLFAYIAPHAPHLPAAPPPRYVGALPDQGYASDSYPDFNEADVSDKPAWVQALSPWTEEEIQQTDASHERMYESLLAVDDLVGGVIQALEGAGRFGRTLFVFASDNGLLLGGHRWGGKLAAYEESIRVPLVVRYDQVLHGQAGTSSRLVTNLDYSELFADAAGITIPGPTDGLDLMTLLRNPNSSSWRTSFGIEHWAPPGTNSGVVTSYCAVRTKRWKWVEYQSGERELYDLDADPFEVDNLASSPPVSTKLLHKLVVATGCVLPAS